MNQYTHRLQARLQAIANLPQGLSREEAFHELQQQPELGFYTFNAYRNFMVRLQKEQSGHISTPRLPEVIPPESFEEKTAIFKLPAGLERVALLSDIHVPYHSKDALIAAINYEKTRSPDCVYLNGDALDFYSISRHEKEPDKRDLKREVELGRELFGFIRYQFPKAQIYWKLGNHEDRWKKYIDCNAQDLAWLEELQLEKLFRLNKLGIEIIDSHTIGHIGELSVLHGHELKGGGGGINPARWLYLRTAVNTACAHFHRSSHYSERILSGKTISCWSTGTMSELNPKYFPINKWNNGFAHIDVETSGQFYFQNKTIIDGKVY